MEPIDALAALDAIDPVAAPAAVLQLSVEPPPPTHASTSTGFDRWPILDPAAASIAATAAAQDLRTFQLSQLLLQRRRPGTGPNR